MGSLVFADRVAETTTTTGTGAVTLGGAKTGYQSFAAIGDGNQCYYVIAGGSEWEVGIGTYTASGTTLSRDTILASSNSGSAVSFSSGMKDVFADVPASFVRPYASKVVTSGSQTTISFSSIPQYFTDLELTLVGGDTLTTGTGEVATQMQINGDSTSGNYTSARYLVGTGGAASGSVAASSLGVSIGIIPGTSGNANAVGSAIIRIPNYSGAVFQKLVDQRFAYAFGASGLDVGAQMWIWKSTAAVTSLLLTANNAFRNGTTAVLRLR